MRSTRSSKGSSSSTSSSISTAHTKVIIDRLKSERVRNLTRRNYYCVWKDFNEFFIKLDVKPKTWEERMLLYAGFLVEDGKKAQTVRSYMSSIKGVLLEDGVEINQDKFLLSAITRACSYKNASVQTRLPIQKGTLYIILQKLNDMFETQPYLLKMYRALYSTVYFGHFRVGELTVGYHPVRARDVHIADNKNKLMFVLHTSKTHWTNDKRQFIKISSENWSGSHPAIVERSICPFTILQEFLDARKAAFRTQQEPFFIFQDRSPVTTLQFRRVLKATLEQVGLDYCLYDSHSLRIRRSIDLLHYGVSIPVIRKIGR